MARKDILLGITNAESVKPERSVTSGYTTRGASRSMLSSIGELAAQAAKAGRLIEGETIVELDTDLIDGSFVSDRIENDDEALNDLVQAIKERGQDSPILVRSHPSQLGRYQIIFGHRRVKAAVQLKIPVRAVVKDLHDRDHIIAQGQENSARANLSFIERAVFAESLQNLGYDKDTVMSALSIDAPMLTRMNSVVKRIPTAVVQAIGPAKGVGRDKWLELTSVLEKPANATAAVQLIETASFAQCDKNMRFDFIYSALNPSKKPPKKSHIAHANTTWSPDDRSVVAKMKNSQKGFNLSISAKHAGVFGQFISDNLQRYYQEFREAEKLKQTGD
jgi:ParB family transcriptional regulator, chromosome partitioning protein